MKNLFNYLTRLGWAEDIVEGTVDAYGNGCYNWEKEVTAYLSDVSEITEEMIDDIKKVDKDR